MQSTARILNTNNKGTLDEIYPKMFFNSSEWVIESSYNNPYCACLYMKFNRIDSPIIIIPTLDTPETQFEFELKVYSNRQTNIYSLNTDACSLLMGEWKENTSGGCHLTQDERKDKIKDEMHTTNNKFISTWYDNPKFNLAFVSKERIPSVEFEIILTRSESIWKPIITKGVVNSMIRLYVLTFEFRQH